MGSSRTLKLEACAPQKFSGCFRIPHFDVLPSQLVLGHFTRRDRGVKLRHPPPGLPLCNSCHDGREPCAPVRIGKEDRNEGRSRMSQCGSGACSDSTDR